MNEADARLAISTSLFIMNEGSLLTSCTIVLCRYVDLHVAQKCSKRLYDMIILVSVDCVEQAIGFMAGFFVPFAPAKGYFSKNSSIYMSSWL